MQLKLTGAQTHLLPATAKVARHVCAHALHPCFRSFAGRPVQIAESNSIDVGICQCHKPCTHPIPQEHLTHQLVRQAGAGGHKRQHHRLAAQRLRRLGALLCGDRAPVQLLQLRKALQDLGTPARSCWLTLRVNVHCQAEIMWQLDST